MTPNCDSCRGHSWIGQHDDTLDNFEANGDEVLVDAECELCGTEERLILECRDKTELESDLQDWQNKESQPTNDIHAVLLDVTNANFGGGHPYAESKLAVYYEGEHDPDYPLDRTYTYEQ